MTRTLTGTIGVWLLAAVAVVAADFWEEKAFTAWSDKEVEKMLTDSPWAKQQRIVLGTLSEAPETPVVSRGGHFLDAVVFLPNIPGETLGGQRAATLELQSAWEGLENGVQRVVLAGGAQFGGIRRVKVTVTWNSALPIKQALVRRAIGRDTPVRPSDQAALTQPDPLYAVTLSGLPPDFRELVRMGDSIKASTVLKRKNGEPIGLEEVYLFEDSRDQTISVVFSFPKTDTITLDDEEIELVTDLGGSPLKKKFKLADMVFHGQLTL